MPKIDYTLISTEDLNEMFHALCKAHKQLHKAGNLARDGVEIHQFPFWDLTGVLIETSDQIHEELNSRARSARN